MICRNSLFPVVLAVAIGAGSAFAQGTCNLSGSTITCTGGQGAHVVQTGLTTAGTTTAADHFPTTIVVPTAIGSGKTVSTVSITLNGYTSVVNGGLAVPQRSSLDMGLLLASPTGRNLEVMRSVGRGSVAQNNFTITLQDGGTAFVINTNFASGTLAPASFLDPITMVASPNYAGVGGPSVLHRAQTQGSSTLNSTSGVFTGEQANGNWSLYLADDSNANVQFTSWSMILTVTAASTPSTTTLTPNPTTAYTSSPNNSVVLSAAITAGATGNVTFKDGATNLSCTEGVQPRPVASNSATCTTTFSTEGVHVLSANYSGDGTFVASSGIANIFVQNHATNVGTTYCNTGAIANPTGRSDLLFTNTVPYPSVIFIGDGVNADLASSVNTASVTLKNLSSAVSTAVRFLLMAPDGTHAFAFWADAGAGAATTGDYTIMDGAPQLPQASGLVPGTYGPTDYSVNPDTFSPGPPAPAPQVPPSFSIPAPKGSKTFNTSLAGAAAHGAWSLFMFSDGGGFSSTTVGGGWCLNITPGTGHITTTSVNANPVQAAKNVSVTFTATITSSPAVGNTGTVTFTENGNILTGAPNSGVANVVGGVATIATSALSEGDHTITASYHDASATYNDSFNSVTMRVDAATATPTLSGSTWSYCNTSAIVIPAGQFAVNDFGPAQPNPSNIFVANLPGTILSVGLTLKGFHLTSPQNLESLLVGPNGGAAPTTAQTLDFFSFTGGGVPFGPQDTTFNDSGSLVSASSAPGSVNAPTSRGATSYTPSAFYNLPGTFQFAAPQGNFTFNTGINGVFPNKDPNGTWSVYFDQNIHHTNDGANGGWCMNFIENPVTVGATASHVGHPDGHFMQGELGALLTVVIHNNGDANAKGSTGDPDNLHPLTVVDVLPANLDYTPGTLPTGSPWSCTAVGQTVTCVSHNTIAAGGNYPTLTIPVNVANAAGTSDNNSVTVSGGGVTTTTSNTDNIIIDPAPVLSIAKSHSVTFKQGQTAVWNLQVTNNAATTFGATDGTSVTVSDTLPTGYTMASFTGTNWNCTGNNVVTCTTTDKIAGAGGSFNPLALTVNVPAASPVSVTNIAKAFGGGDLVHVDANSGATGSDPVNNVVQVPASVSATGGAGQGTPINTAFGTGLQATVNDANNAVVVGPSVTVTFTAPNSGASGTFAPGNTLTDVVVTTTGVATSHVFTANGVGGGYNVVASVIGATSANFGLTNQAPDMTVTQPVHAAVQQGQLGVTFPITAMNLGSLTTTASVGVTVMLSAGLTATGLSGAGWTCSALPALSCSRSDVLAAAGNYPVLTLTASVSNTAGSTVTVTAAVSGGGETNTTNNSSPAVAAVTQVPDLTITKTNSPNFTQGQTGATYTLTVSNVGGAATSGTVTVTDTLPSGLIATSLSGAPPWSCLLGTLTCTRGDALVSGASYPPITLTVNVTANAPASVTNVASVSGGGEVNTLNSAATDPTPIIQSSPANVTAAAGTPQGAYINTPFAINPQVVVKDGGNNPVSGATVTFTAPGAGPSGTFQGTNTNTATAPTNASGVATAPAFTANGLTGSYNVTASVGGAGATFALQNNASSAPTTDSASDAVTGSTHVLTLNYSSPGGFGNLVDTYVLLNGTFNISKACWVFYDTAAGGFFLVNDTATALLGPVTPGSGTQSNGQCTLNGAGSSIGHTGSNTVVMTVSVTFLAGFNAAESIYMYAADASSQNSGWNYRGTTTALSLAAPTADAVTGSVPGTLTLQYSSLNGFGYLTDVYALMNGSFNGSNACWVFYDRPSNGFYLVNDADNGLIGPLTPGANSSLVNAQCTLNGALSSVNGSGNTLTVQLNLAFTNAFGNGKQVFMYAADQGGRNSGWQNRGTTTPIVATAPTVDTVTGAGATLNQTLTFQYSSVNGYGYLADAYMLINGVEQGAPACWVFFDKGANGYFLVNDAATALIGPLALGSAGTLTNSQCTLNGTASSVSGSGNTLTMVLNLTFKSPPFNGSKTILMNVSDDAGTFAGWVSRGNLTVP